ncbi:hypothetical protein [Marmoricola endophyticus]|uniref:hypothetical protein n=1 Tax=Marmoricola endophyticus TaxID=2040280 RepID=UPI0016681672|nr:hypothetical protein [Marmoricola endophyticus]
MGTLAWVVGTVIVVVLIVLGLPYFSDRMTKGGGGASAGGNALGAMDAIFNPGADRARTSLTQDQEKKGSQARGEGEDPEEPDEDEHPQRPAGGP